MSNQYIGEVRAFGFNFAPLSWAQCNGQTIQIDQNAALFQILGTTYGGNGQTNFLLPNLQDLTAVGMGQGAGLMNWSLGMVFGEEAHTLQIAEVPQHSHVANFAAGVSFQDQKTVPSTTSYPARAQANHAYSAASDTILAPTTIGVTGGSLPHNNIQPVQVVNFCIALYGVFPTQA